MRQLGRLSTAALLAVSLALAGCKKSSDARTRTAAEAETFTFINRGDLITQDLNQMSYLQDFRIAMGIREGLYGYEPTTLEPVMTLCTGVETSADKKTWTFKIRPEGKWSNGDPVVAGDFIFSWRVMLESPGEYTSLFYVIDGAAEYEKAYRDQTSPNFETVGVKALDEHTLQVKLKDPVPYLPELMAFAVFYPRHAASMEKFKSTDAKGRMTYKDEYTRAENVVLNGPFLLKTWTPGREVVMEPNPNYWDKSGLKLKRVRMLANDDPSSAKVQFDQGKVDWLADVAPDIASQMRDASRPELKTVMAFGTAFLTVNCGESVEGVSGKNPLSDVRVRQALAMSIDKQQICDLITRMGEKPAAFYVPPGFFKDYTAKPAVSLDLANAKQLLADAGYPNGKGWPTIAITYNSDNPTRKRFAELLSENWKNQLGIKVDLDPLELKSYRDKITHKKYTLGAAAWYGDYFDPSTFAEKYRSNSGNNDSNWAPPKFDKLLDLAAAEPDEKKRYQYYADAETMINDQLPVIPLYYYVNVSAIDSRVNGLVENAKNLVVWKNLSLSK